MYQWTYNTLGTCETYMIDFREIESQMVQVAIMLLLGVQNMRDTGHQAVRPEKNENHAMCYRKLRETVCICFSISTRRVLKLLGLKIFLLTEIYLRQREATVCSIFRSKSRIV